MRQPRQYPAYKKAWAAANKDKTAAMQRKFRRTLQGKRLSYQAKLRNVYGIEPEDAARAFERQKGLCAVVGCRTPLLWDRDTHIDHCHATLKFRGLLCKRCNLALGAARDSVGILRSLAAYLELSRLC